jgi:hypothetical protein
VSSTRVPVVERVRGAPASWQFAVIKR